MLATDHAVTELCTLYCEQMPAKLPVVEIDLDAAVIGLMPCRVRDDTDDGRPEVRIDAPPYLPPQGVVVPRQPGGRGTAVAKGAEGVAAGERGAATGTVAAPGSSSAQPADCLGDVA